VSVALEMVNSVETQNVRVWNQVKWEGGRNTIGVVEVKNPFENKGKDEALVQGHSRIEKQD